MGVPFSRHYVFNGFSHNGQTLTSSTSAMPGRWETNKVSRTIRIVSYVNFWGLFGILNKTNDPNRRTNMQMIWDFFRFSGPAT